MAKPCKKYNKEAYNTVTVLKNLSGFTWSDEKGLDITIETEKVFEDYLAVSQSPSSSSSVSRLITG